MLASGPSRGFQIRRRCRQACRQLDRLEAANTVVYPRNPQRLRWPREISSSPVVHPGHGHCPLVCSVGIALVEGYGLTETSPVIAINTPVKQRMGAVGWPLKCELSKSPRTANSWSPVPSVFAGYWQKPAAIAECFDRGGLFRTGDIGHLDADGFLYITDRKKELLKTSGGKLVAPQPIENKLKNSFLVAQAALVGDRHKFISALISPNFAALEEWARHHGVNSKSPAELVADSRVVALYAEIVREVNGTLANFESLKRFRVVADEWTQESGELTPSMKLKRRVITERYAALIDALYADEATARGE